MPRILHLGVGNFFRAHQAWYTQASPGWSITGVSFRSSAVRDALQPQNFDYTLVIKDRDGTRYDRITCLDDVLFAGEQADQIVGAIASSDYDVITLTVTEKAYHLRPDGQLDLDHPDVQQELKGPLKTVVGYLAHGLARRTAPATVVCCDNLPDNGTKLERAVRSFWAAAHLTPTAPITFPSCMVDRISPATTPAIQAEAQDPMAVPTETFTEWVVEDRFAGARPAWPGVEWVRDVAPHEMRKLRMLNGAHSFLAYAGLLKGATYVHEAISDPELRARTKALMAETAETLPPEMRQHADPYARELVKRFENPNLHHKLRQIAMDGTQKMPIRIIAPRDARGQSLSPALSGAVDAWVAFVRAEVSAGRTLDDPQSDALVAACEGAEADAALREIIGAGSPPGDQ